MKIIFEFILPILPIDAKKDFAKNSNSEGLRQPNTQIVVPGNWCGKIFAPGKRI